MRLTAANILEVYIFRTSHVRVMRGKIRNDLLFNVFRDLKIQPFIVQKMTSLCGIVAGEFYDRVLLPVSSPPLLLAACLLFVSTSLATTFDYLANTCLTEK